LPLELIALSNMPIIDEKLTGNVKTVYFDESPLMSTYLVAVVIGLFDYVEDTTADGVYAHPRPCSVVLENRIVLFSQIL